MKKKIMKIAILIIVIIILLIILCILLKYCNNKNKITCVYKEYLNNNINNKSVNENNNKITNTTDNLMLQIDGQNVIGVIKIEKINFEGVIYDGTSLQILAKGVGHFENTPYFDGNVCLAAHNTNAYWAKLHTLSVGDKIQYTSFLGTKEYEVNTILKINETDWSYLKNTETNMLTLITCVKGQKNLRLCVQAREIK